MITTRAAIVDEVGGDFRIGEVTLEEPRSNEVIVRLVATGVCHTDLNVQGGNLDYSFPAVLGHEGAGIVEKVGDAVDRVEIGDRVLLSFTSCGRCAQCRKGRVALCTYHLPWNLLSGRRADGSTGISQDGRPVSGHFFGQSSFAERALVSERSIVRLPKDTTDEDLIRFAPLGCGIQTGAGAILNVLKPEVGDTVVVAGAGAVGLAAVMAAALSPAQQIVVVDRVPSRLDLAVKLGATATIDTSEVDYADAVSALTDGVGPNIAIDTTGNIGVIDGLLGSLAIGGRGGLIGAPKAGSLAHIDVNRFLPGRSVVGITEGASEPESFIPQLIDLYRRGRFPIDALLSNYRFDEIDAAVAATRSGEAIKPVLVFG
ncbi:NAD(P)-dependent alcohol dehydrogenase [Gulosibacter molinativorax]|uniref:NAD(P)-dependent alcohol dehydrogenase n=1 Tax=Gulosibacter molinativorax TaxID=256821 RepID=A0ABT7CBQ6_9MICO|nr:NAD(P)-dependent alcohol dehydrogenase [Gulosibacter molinativorax]MDJ1372624.1 NAD(P)-dependent alcohol dehydrogenase [Gulosibacter molinativorax]QUY62592.1 Aryl-alcohol dehydrogenase [Gulosibacter molinativorax]